MFTVARAAFSPYKLPFFHFYIAVYDHNNFAEVDEEKYHTKNLFCSRRSSLSKRSLILQKMLPRHVSHSKKWGELCAECSFHIFYYSDELQLLYKLAIFPLLLLLFTRICQVLSIYLGNAFEFIYEIKKSSIFKLDFSNWNNPRMYKKITNVS